MSAHESPIGSLDLIMTLDAFIERPPPGGIEVVLQAAKDEILSLRDDLDYLRAQVAKWSSYAGAGVISAPWLPNAAFNDQRVREILLP